jgi:hypothetical protein
MLPPRAILRDLLNSNIVVLLPELGAKWDRR